MKTHRFEWLLGAALAMLFVAFWIWQSPGNLQKLSSAEVDAYLHRLEGNLPGEPNEADVQSAMPKWPKDTIVSFTARKKAGRWEIVDGSISTMRLIPTD